MERVVQGLKPHVSYGSQATAAVIATLVKRSATAAAEATAAAVAVVAMVSLARDAPIRGKQVSD